MLNLAHLIHACLAVTVIVIAFKPFHLVIKYEQELILKFDQVLAVVISLSLAMHSEEYCLLQLYLLPLFCFFVLL